MRRRPEAGGTATMLTWLFAGGALLVAGAGLLVRRRMSRLRGGLSDEAIRAIEEYGRIAVDEPLDLDEAAEEEERFWSESWDEPEPL
ncbi:MAG: LPXTG cell wall anchor domain-containing protein [Gemmatimonadetes bacterium]|nr:LPXTG cell wall anchor domain-containing protein [Gemmatimonadota bacterium]